MTDSPRRKRSLRSTVLGVFVVAAMLVVLLVMRVLSLFRKYTPIEELKFPVLVIQPGGVPLFAEWDSIALQKFDEHSARTPVEGTILIDSDFNQYVQENVERARDGDLTWLARRYLAPGLLRVKYKFDLRKSKSAGLDALRTLIRAATPVSDDAEKDTTRRADAVQQVTMAGVLDALHFYKPPEPVTQPALAELPTTEPTAIEPTTQSDEQPPGMGN